MIITALFLSLELFLTLIGLGVFIFACSAAWCLVRYVKCNWGLPEDPFCTALFPPTSDYYYDKHSTKFTRGTLSRVLKK